MLPEIGILNKVSTRCLPGLVERSKVRMITPVEHCFVNFKEGFSEFPVVGDTSIPSNFAW